MFGILTIDIDFIDLEIMAAYRGVPPYVILDEIIALYTPCLN
jgi:hypothetical protein